MKILLTAINAKYIHSNPAVYSLRAYAGETLAPFLEIAEYTVNHKEEEILADLYRRKPDVIAFSCYIWNWSMVSRLLPELPKILPGVHIWLGGPEVSYNPDELLASYPMIGGIMIGEGEETFRELAAYYCGKDKNCGGAQDADNSLNSLESMEGTAYCSTLESIKGIVYRGGDAVHRAKREPVDMSKLPFLYENPAPFENKIIYYESSRGCPFHCSYCLSSIDKGVRLRSLDIVKKELQFFLDHKVKQVKFVDRTFNCNHEHAIAIWRYLSENDNGVTNFHFEIAADILGEEEFEILSSMRPGLVQMEIGVQTLNTDTLREIRRTTNLVKLKAAVERIQGFHNIHVHLDLIAGLPYEDYESFVRSFNGVYAMAPEQLQLGFLKILKGSYMAEKAADYGMQYKSTPPYEVLSTKWLPYEKLLCLKQVEEMVEIYYNSNQFRYTMPVLQTGFPDAYTMYLQLADFYRRRGYSLFSPSRSYRYEALLAYAEEAGLRMAGKEGLLAQVLTFDLYLRENMKSRPDFARDLTPYKARIREFYRQEEAQRKYLPAYAGYDARQLARMTHIEFFDYPVWEKSVPERMKKLDNPQLVLFDYHVRDALTYEANYQVVPTSVYVCSAGS
ncbi:MAG: B12-binding domain-containing radical SAM protein [Muribaculaceae bacterium]|nr:B12-binding domain-containing radical SAM protein [Muribaculaceae bacterium]